MKKNAHLWVLLAFSKQWTIEKQTKYTLEKSIQYRQHNLVTRHVIVQNHF